MSRDWSMYDVLDAMEFLELREAASALAQQEIERESKDAARNRRR